MQRGCPGGVPSERGVTSRSPTPTPPSSTPPMDSPRAHPAKNWKKETVREQNGVALSRPCSADRSGAGGHGTARIGLREIPGERSGRRPQVLQEVPGRSTGVPVLASADVADEALQRTHDIVTHLLAGRPDILEAMAKTARA